MVTGIMKRETILNLGTRLVSNSNIEQFVVAILSWYQNYDNNQFGDPEISPFEPPNLFQLFEYPSYDGESIMQLIIDSEVEKQMKCNPSYEYESVEKEVIYTFDNAYYEIYGFMISDVQLVMDAYHLFYCFQDSPDAPRIYYNSSVTEVW